MNNTEHSASTALPLAHNVLRILIVGNWITGALITILLVAMPSVSWARTALHVPPGPEGDRLIFGLHLVAILGLVAIGLNYIILKRLLAIVETVRARDPFVAVNADRLRTIAWTLMALQVISIVIGTIGRMVSTPANPLHLDAGFSWTGWLAVLLTFLLARVFAEGTLMRAELEGTV